MERINLREIRDRISWGSIFAGVITVLAISILLSILASSVGLFMFNPLSDHPTSGIGTTVGIWTIVSMIISLFAGGFVAGKLAGADGMIHGFLVWATTMIVTVILGAILAIGAVKLTANILGSVSSVTGNVLSGVGSAVGSGVSELSDQAQDIFGNIDWTTDDNEKSVPENIRQALKKSGVKEFQPDYLQNQLNDIKTDLNKSVKKLVTNPKDANQIINGFTDRLKKRADKFSKNVNKDDVAKAIANNSNLTKAEATKAVDQYTDLINNAIAQGKEQIANLEQSIQKAQQEWEAIQQKAKVETEKATNAAARSALWSFFGMLIGAALCTYAGYFGTKKTKQGYEV